MPARRTLFYGLVLLCCATALGGWRPRTTSAQRRTQARGARPLPPPEFSAARESAYRANNRGVALLEQFKARDAVAEFQRALRLAPHLPLAQINLAIAAYYVPDLAAAQRAAAQAAQLAPAAPQPPYLLGLIARAENRTDEAIAAFHRVLEIDPRDAGAHINLGQLYAQRRDYAAAGNAFRAALVAEPYNVTALYNLGTTLVRTNQREEGQRFLQRSQELRQSGAGTTLGQNYLEQGRYAEAVVSTGAEPDLVDRRTPDVVFTDVTARVLPRPAPDAWPLTNTILDQNSGAVLLFDYDGDGDLDLLEVSGRSQRLYRNDGGKFTDVTAQAGGLAQTATGAGTGAIAGDYDNDGRPDLFILRYNASALYHNNGNGQFTDVNTAAEIPNYPYLARAAAFFDYDHDGDLDIFIAGSADAAETLKVLGDGRKQEESRPSNTLYTIGMTMPPAPCLLLRNNGDGTFTDQTAAAKLSGAFAASAVVPTDFDNRRDVDLLVATDNGMTLWRNMRDGTFNDVAVAAGLGAEELKVSSSVAVGDVNKDGFIDFYFGRGATGDFALSDGRDHFQLKRGPGELPVAPLSPAAKYNNAAQFLDYDNDGLLDLVTVVTTGGDGVHIELRIWRNTGDDWVDVSDKATRGLKAEIGPISGPLAGARLLAAGDIDGDGDTDIIFGVPGGGLRVARNDGGNRNRSVRVRLNGRVSNRSAVEAKIELRAGSLQQRIETYAASPAPAPADVLFGLGRRAAPDAVRVQWPSGTVQAETESEAIVLPRVRGTKTQGRAQRNAPTVAVLSITELDRKPSSCPFLYTWNGARFEFVTDFMGGGEMGDWLAPGLYNTPDPDEYVRIRAEQLKPRAGRYELRVTNELEEALFVDRLQLVAVAHPQGTEVYPDEGLREQPPPFKLYATRAPHPPVAAHDDHGHDVRAQIAKLDRRYLDDFALAPIRGYAAPHTLTLDLGRADHAAQQQRVLLLLTGWTDYAFSSDNVAATQQGRAQQPPALQVKDARGQWQTVIANIGIPVGRPQTLIVDLTGKFLSAHREVRLVTNLRVYWDRIQVGTADDAAGLQLTRLDPVRAELRWRGFSQELKPDGREPLSYDYARVTQVSPWRAFPGRYTRVGDVRELLTATDDMFVVSRTGDELSLAFDATTLPALPSGWTRTFLLYADGFSKEMNLHSASPDLLAPLPFHGMRKYPYTAPEAYPLTKAHVDYLERYNTRVVVRPLVPLAGRDE